VNDVGYQRVVRHRVGCSRFSNVRCLAGYVRSARNASRHLTHQLTVPFGGKPVPRFPLEDQARRDPEPLGELQRVETEGGAQRCDVSGRHGSFLSFNTQLVRRVTEPAAWLLHVHVGFLLRFSWLDAHRPSKFQRPRRQTSWRSRRDHWAV
jgi:hypothetical protein